MVLETLPFNCSIDEFKANVRLVDCVGYVIPGAKGYEDENGPRMVKTPWVQWI